MKFIEFGSLILAVGFSVTLAKGYYERSEKLSVAKDREVSNLEEFHSAVVDYRLKWEEEQDRLAKEFPPTEEMEPMAKRCFSSYNCYKLAEAVYHEDRGGGIEGMKAVANVIMNRVASHKFPKTIAGVVNQKRKNSAGYVVCQFSYVCLKKNLKMDEQEWKIKSGWVAYRAYKGELRDRTNGADHYYNPNLVKSTPGFAKVYTQVASISDHLFYRSTVIQ